MLNLDLGLIFFVSAQHQHVIEGAVSLADDFLRHPKLLRVRLCFKSQAAYSSMDRKWQT